MANTPVGWRVWYGDGRILTSQQMLWEALPSTDVQFVTQYFAETYEIFKTDGYDGAGQPINPRTVTENRCEQHYAQEYYWLDQNTGFIVSGAALPAGVLSTLGKRGRSIAEAAFRSIYNQASENRRWP
jgi:hypothetical protein